MCEPVRSCFVISPIYGLIILFGQSIQVSQEVGLRFHIKLVGEIHMYNVNGIRYLFSDDN